MRISLLLCMALLLAACGTKTTVVLLPDEQGQVGRVEVVGAKGSQTVTRAYAYTEVGGSERPEEARTMTAEAVNRDFGQALAVEPLPAQSYLLYFHSGKTELKRQSLDLIPDIVAAIEKRPMAEVNIIGHSDSVGQRDYNLGLSTRRAEVVEKLLVKHGVPAQSMNLYSHGENDPLVPTEDGVAEPRNRRVEVFIR